MSGDLDFYRAERNWLIEPEPTGEPVETWEELKDKKDNEIDYLFSVSKTPHEFISKCEASKISIYDIDIMEGMERFGETDLADYLYREIKEVQRLKNVIQEYCSKQTDLINKALQL